MSYSVQQLPNKRWGIYSTATLLATYGCQHTCLIVLELLEERSNANLKTYYHSVEIVKEAA